MHSVVQAHGGGLPHVECAGQHQYLYIYIYIHTSVDLCIYMHRGSGTISEVASIVNGI